MSPSLKTRIFRPKRLRSRAAFGVVLALFLSAPVYLRADPPQPLTLQDAMSLALRYNPGVVASEAQREAAKAGERTAAAYPNPVVEAGAGPSVYRDNRSGVSNNWAVGITQPIDYPALRASRLPVAFGLRET